MGDRTVLKGMLHRVTTTQSELHYEGSCAIDEALLLAAGIREYEQIEIHNVSNGERFTTYAIRGERDSGIVSANGAAARRTAPGDLLDIAAYGVVGAAEADSFRPRLVYVDARNRIVAERSAVPRQAAA